VARPAEGAPGDALRHALVVLGERLVHPAIGQALTVLHAFLVVQFDEGVAGGLHARFGQQLGAEDRLAVVDECLVHGAADIVPAHSLLGEHGADPERALQAGLLQVERSNLGSDVEKRILCSVACLRVEKTPSLPACL